MESDVSEATSLFSVLYIIIFNVFFIMRFKHFKSFHLIWIIPTGLFISLILSVILLDLWQSGSGGKVVFVVLGLFQLWLFLRWFLVWQAKSVTSVLSIRDLGIFQFFSSTPDSDVLLRENRELRASLARQLQLISQFNQAELDYQSEIARLHKVKQGDYADVIEKLEQEVKHGQSQLNEAHRKISILQKELREANNRLARVSTPSSAPRSQSGQSKSKSKSGLTRGSTVSFEYTNAEGETRHRLVRITSVSGGYLNGFDFDRDGKRTFRLDRITDGEITNLDTGEVVYV